MIVQIISGKKSRCVLNYVILNISMKRNLRACESSIPAGMKNIESRLYQTWYLNDIHSVWVIENATSCSELHVKPAGLVSHVWDIHFARGQRHETSVMWNSL